MPRISATMRGALFYTADNINYRDLMAVDIESGENTMLIEDARIGDLVFNKLDRSIWALRHLNGLVSLVRIPAPYTEWKMIFSWPHGLVPFEMDISPDGSLLSVSMGEISGDQFLRIFRIEDLMVCQFQLSGWKLGQEASCRGQSRMAS